MMTQLLDTSVILAHQLAEPGFDQVQALFDDEANILGICVLTLLELDCRLRDLGMNETAREAEVSKYKFLFDEIVPVTETICAGAVRLKFAATARLPSIDALIAASAKQFGATLVHRDPHFLRIPTVLLSQELIAQK